MTTRKRSLPWEALLTAERSATSIAMLSEKSFEVVIDQVNVYLRGWIGYYYLASRPSEWREFDSWIRRKLRCYKLKQKKRGSTIAKYLMSLGMGEIESLKLGSSGKGWWRLSRTRALHRALDNAWFKDQGLICLEEKWAQLLKA
ncbi:group II intron maturase-specific domain-containing protein [Methylophaga thalassica]|uniref:group II intron maturase-specific domain-containing protein n=1 Tax=Methylophaga aminisulfidivorans TaxID=230105 RepID=UPI003D6B37DD